MIKELIEAVRLASNFADGNPISYWIKPFKIQKETKEQPHQFVLFLKPEATAIHENVNTEEVLRIVFDTFQKHGIETGSQRVLTAEYLKRYSIMDQHYGVINAVSRQGLAGISEKAKDVLNEKFKDAMTNGATVLGGHQFIAQFPEFTPFTLSTFSDNLGVTKLASGTYCTSIKIEGVIYLVLNAFHPYQLQYYTGRNKSIVVLECFSSKPWRFLRDQIAGGTDPQVAAEGSIRKELLNKQKSLGIPDVNRATNGIHLSAGPLEGMIEIIRFFSDFEKQHSISYSETSFGLLLQEKGASAESIEHLGSNPDLELEGRTLSAFDLTEEIDAHEAVQKLIEFKKGMM